MKISGVSRRLVLGGLAAALPTAAKAQGRLLTSTRPVLRGDRKFGPSARPYAEILGESGLGDVTGFMVAELSTGRVLESYRPQVALPPASVAKSITALYGLSALGEGYRFRTSVYATGPVQNGRVRGDLYLVGSGDPTLDTDKLADLAKAVAAAGIFGVEGRCYVVSAALPYHREIDPDQPAHVGYNPAISGLNLNYNRVHFQWKRASQGYTTQMTARAARHDTPVTSVRVSIVNRDQPVFSYRSIEGRDHWSVAANALGRGGSRWLPVRTPAVYAAEVFRALAYAQNTRLPEFGEKRALPQGAREVASVSSPSFRGLMKGMLRYSTNLTAEVAGLRAAQRIGRSSGSLDQSGQAMTTWLRGRFGLSKAKFVNHSGLSDASRMTAAEMVQFLDIAAAETVLPEILKDIPLVNGQGKADPVPGVSVVAKTGTLNFTRALAGYVNGPRGKLAFAIFSADLNARRAGGGVERPRGGASWTGRARRQEQALLRRWARLFAG